MTIIDTAYESLDQNNTQSTKEWLLHLRLVRKEISQLFKKGKISDAYYNILDNKISQYIEGSIGCRTLIDSNVSHLAF